MRIGEFARLGGVSIKALRYYAREGLLRPAIVDERNGYRYYGLDQLETLAAVTNLRAAGFSIRDISRLITTGSPDRDFQPAVAERKASLEEQRAEIDEKLLIVDAFSRAVKTKGASALSSFKLMALQSELVFSIREKTASLGSPVTKLFEEAEALVAEYEARADRPPFLMFHDGPDQTENIDLEVVIPLTHDPGERCPATTTPHYEYACSAIYAGDYDATAPIHREMLEWIETAGLSPAGPLREVYHRFGAEQKEYRLPAHMTVSSSTEFITELQIPISLNTTN